MKKLKHLFFLVTVILSCNQVYAMPTQPSIIVNQCFTTEEAVFIPVGTSWFRVEAVKFTPNGVFVMEQGEWLSIKEAMECDSHWTWTCRKCGTINALGDNTCSRCGGSG